jgi:hypothetical protein
MLEVRQRSDGVLVACAPMLAGSYYSERAGWCVTVIGAAHACWQPDDAQVDAKASLQLQSHSMVLPSLATHLRTISASDCLQVLSYRVWYEHATTIQPAQHTADTRLQDLFSGQSPSLQQPTANGRDQTAACKRRSLKDQHLAGPEDRCRPVRRALGQQLTVPSKSFQQI